MGGSAEQPEAEPGFIALRELVESVPAVIYEAEPGVDGVWRYVSPHIQALVGHSPEEWTADPAVYLECLHPDDREAVLEVENRELEAARAGDVTAVTEYRMVHRDGHVVWVRDEARLVGEDDDVVWRGMLVDVTAERALADAYDSYRSLVESLPGCLYRSETGTAGRWTFLSPQIESLVGYSSSELMDDSRKRLSLLHPDDQDWVLAEELEGIASESGAQWLREYRLIPHSGAPIWVRDRGVVSGTHGDRTVEGILTDVTASRAALDDDEAAPDVFRLTCPRCGSVWAGEKIEACGKCGNTDVDSVSLDATLRKLGNAKEQLESLVDGIQGHLEMLKATVPERTDSSPSSSRGRLRIVTPLHEDPDAG
jgi:PAS domain S-box-containing protein